MKDKKYFACRSLHLAMSIGFITGQKYMVFDNNEGNGRKVYSFEMNEKVKEALDILNDARERLHD